MGSGWFRFMLQQLLYNRGIMKRPQSAKARQCWPQLSSDDPFSVQDAARNFFRPSKKMMMMHNVAATNDLSRLLPKHIPQDKERLYGETLQLKNSVNQLTEQNLRLKTKVAILQREKDKLNKNSDSASKKASKSGGLHGSNLKNDKQNGIVANLKKLVRQSKQQSQVLKSQALKLKRTIRYTKINELEVEKQALYEQNRKQAHNIQQLYLQLETRVRQQQRLTQLENQLRHKAAELKEVTADNMKYEQLLEELQMSHQQALEKILVSEKKWQRDNAVEKRKGEQLSRHNEHLRREVKLLNQKLEEERKKSVQKKIVRPASSNPARESNSSKLKTNTEVQQALMVNEKLKKQLQGAKKKLAESQNQLKSAGKAANSLNITGKDELIDFQLTKNADVTNNLQNPIREEEEYAQDFQTTQMKAPQLQSRIYQQLPIMSQIRQILTYRMKYNRYPFSEIQADIQASSMTSFTYSDLMNMLMGEPFFLSQNYSYEFLKVCYGRSKIKPSDELALNKLISNLRKVINQFELLGEEEQENMLYKLADFMTKHRVELQISFKRLAKDDRFITVGDLQSVFKQYPEVSQEQIDLVICYISGGCQNLHSIDYVQLLDKFYMNNSRSSGRQSMSKGRSEKLNSKQVDKQYDELSLGQNQQLDNSQPLSDDEMI